MRMKAFFWEKKKKRGKRRILFGQGKYHNGGHSHTVQQTNRHCEDRARILDSEFAIKKDKNLENTSG